MWILPRPIFGLDVCVRKPLVVTCGTLAWDGVVADCHQCPLLGRAFFFPVMFRYFWELAFNA